MAQPSLLDALRQYLRDAAPGGALNPEVTGQGILDAGAMATAPVPGVGDVVGLLADANRMRDPAERTPMNMALMAIGALPLVPSGLGAARKALNKADDVADFVKKIEGKFPGIKFDLMKKSDGSLELSRIVVPKESRNLGVGSQVMNDLKEFADATGRRVELTPSADFGGSKSRLHDFYQRFGFVDNKGSNKDYAISAGMYRQPQRAKTSFEIAHEVAQRNAALPVSQGGLGLPPNNTAMDRARAMGFDTPAYHFSRTGVDANVLDSGEYAMAPFDAIGTHFGSKEAAADRFANTIGTTEKLQGTSYPVMLKGRRQMLNDAGGYMAEEPLSMMMSARSDYGNLKASNQKLRDQIFSSFDMIPYVNDVEAKGSLSYIAPPKNIRSRFAAFDPMKRDSPDLLASLAPYLITGGLAGLLGLSSDNANAGQ